MIVYQEESCCGLLVIGEFPCNYDCTNTDSLQKEIKTQIINQIVNYELENYFSDDGDFIKSNMFIATTNENQTIAAKALKELGFIGVKFDSRHENPGNKLLTLWRKRGYPKEVWTKIKKQLKEMKNNPERTFW